MRRAGTLTFSGLAVALLGGRSSALAAGTTDAAVQQDIRILNTAIAAEHEAVAAYQLGAESGLLEPGTLKVAVTFQGHHRKYVDALVKAVRNLGAEGVDARASYDFPVDQLKQQTDVLKFAAGLERGAVSAYAGAIPSFDNRDLSSAAASILADEAMYWAVLRGALGLDPYRVDRCGIAGKGIGRRSGCLRRYYAPPQLAPVSPSAQRSDRRFRGHGCCPGVFYRCFPATGQSEKSCCSAHLVGTGNAQRRAHALAKKPQVSLYGRTRLRKCTESVGASATAGSTRPQSGECTAATHTQRLYRRATGCISCGIYAASSRALLGENDGGNSGNRNSDCENSLTSCAIITAETAHEIQRRLRN